METKLKALCDRITSQTLTRLITSKLDCEGNRRQAVTHIKEGKKYTKVNIGTSGKYMVVNETGEIFGIKAYGVIHKGHYYGTLDTINDYNWGGYTAVKVA